MRCSPLEIVGAFLLEPEVHEDERGLFTRTFDRDAFAQAGLNTEWAQAAIAVNHRAGTLRGLHYQEEPHPEIKLVRCATGAIFDVIVDLRPDSPTEGRWTSVVLSAQNRRQLYVPAGVAHGYQTLLDDTEVHYLISAEFHADLQRGIRWDDETLAIDWPKCSSRILSARDRQFPGYTACRACC
jgi:dTDP-4-dehydrorhamnose 3,5-epimerase